MVPSSPVDTPPRASAPDRPAVSPWRRRAGLATLAAVAVVGAGLSAGLAIQRTAPPMGQVLLLATVSSPPLAVTPSDRVRVAVIALHPAGSAWASGWRSVSVPPVALAIRGPTSAPGFETLARVAVPSGTYNGIQVGVGASAEAPGQPVRERILLAVPTAGLTPALVVLAARRSATGLTVRPVAAYGGQDGFNFGLQVAAGTVQRLPPITLQDASGQPFRFGALRGKVVVLAAFLTACRETCPLTEASLETLRRDLLQRGIAQDVAIVELTQDPLDDTPAALRVYAAHFHLPWTFLTGSVRAVDGFWSQLKVPALASLACTPWHGPPPIDPFTHRPERCNQTHVSILAVVDPSGYVAAEDLGQPTIRGGVSTLIRDYLDAQGRRELRRAGTWTAGSVLQQILPLLQAQGVAPAYPRPIGAALPGRAAPGFTLPTSGGGRVRLAALRGHPVVVDFFASWCTVCRTELPMLNHVVGKEQPRGLRLLLVDYQESAATARHFLLSLGIRRPALLDREGSVARRYGVGGLPVAVFITRTGRISAIQIGQLTASQLLPLLRPILAGGGV